MEDYRKALLDKIKDIDKFEDPPIQNSGRAVKKKKDPLNKWEGWNSAPDFLLNMVVNSKSPRAMKGFMEQVIRELHMTKREQRDYLRPSNVSNAYRANYRELLNAYPKLNANPTGLTIEQILSQDRHFHRTYVNNNITAQVFARYGLTRYMDGKQWEMKHHKLTNYGWPKFSHDFKNLGFIQVGPEGVKSTGYGWGAAYEIPWTVIDMAAGGKYDPDYWSLFFLSQQMGIFGDERLLLGGAGRNTTGKGAPNLRGLYNWQDAAGNWRDGIVSPSTDYGFSSGKADFEDNWEDILTTFKTNQVFGSGMRPVVYMTTAGICDETTKHDSAVGDLKTEYQILQHKWFRSGILSSWYCTDNLTSTATASMTKATQRWLAFVADPAYIKRTVVYPLQRKILSEKFKTYPEDIAFAYITGDILQVYDQNAIIGPGSDSNAGSGTHGKSTIAGWEMNRLFMDANTVYTRALRPGVE